MSKFVWIISSIILFIVLLFIFLLFWLYSPFPENMNMGPKNIPVENTFENKIVYSSNPNLTQEDYKQDCNRRNGTFNTCGSPCGPEAEFCILMCVYTCEFDNQDNSEMMFENWQTFTHVSQEYSMQYPQEVMIREDARDAMRFMFTGPTQTSNTEIFDGFILTVDKMMKSMQMTFEEFVQKQRSDLQPIAQYLGEVHDTTFAGRSVKGFQANTLGVFNYIYIPFDETEIYKITYAVMDPDNRGYQIAIQKMLDSFKFLGNEHTK